MMRQRIVCARSRAGGFATVLGPGGEVMQRLTVPERLLVVALLPALALLAREFFGSVAQAAFFWPLFSAAIAVSSIGLALLVARSLALPIRQATEAVEPLIAAELNKSPDEPQPRCETA